MTLPHHLHVIPPEDPMPVRRYAKTIIAEQGDTSVLLIVAVIAIVVIVAIAAGLIHG